jgi:hypothetical protein
VSQFCAACVLIVPKFEICVFSTGRRASNLLLEQVLSMLRKFAENNKCDLNDRTQAGAIIVCRAAGCQSGRVF